MKKINNKNLILCFTILCIVALCIVTIVIAIPSINFNLESIRLLEQTNDSGLHPTHYITTPYRKCVLALRLSIVFIVIISIVAITMCILKILPLKKQSTTTTVENTIKETIKEIEQKDNNNDGIV